MDDATDQRTPEEDALESPLTEMIHARGHEHVSARHSSTFEITSDDFLTPAGDCILAIEADRTPADFAPEFIEACQSKTATIKVTIEAGGYSDSVVGRGDPALEFTNERSAVGRTSEYVDDRTVMLEAEHAAEGFDRELVDALEAGHDVKVTFAVECFDKQ